MHALNDWKNEFLRIIDIRIDNFTKHPHLFKKPSSRSVKSLKKKIRNYTVNMSLLLSIKQRITCDHYLKKTLRRGFEG